MIKSKKLVEMTRKVASMGRRVSSSTSSNRHAVADKGHFVVYSSDERRFVVPLEYLATNIFKELFRMSEEEYGLRCNGPITVPCNAIFMEYVIVFAQGCFSEDQEQILIDSIDTARISKCSSLCKRLNNQQVLQCL